MEIRLGFLQMWCKLYLMIHHVHERNVFSYDYILQFTQNVCIVFMYKYIFLGT